MVAVGFLKETISRVSRWKKHRRGRAGEVHFQVVNESLSLSLSIILELLHRIIPFALMSLSLSLSLSLFPVFLPTLLRYPSSSWSVKIRYIIEKTRIPRTIATRASSALPLPLFLSSPSVFLFLPTSPSPFPRPTRFQINCFDVSCKLMRLDGRGLTLAADCRTRWR